MNREEFKLEVLQSDVCPDNFEVIYKEFCQFQDDAIKTLREFHRVCEKNNLHYQLAFGSLLGTIRDSGQIPWDYDVDVIVPYDEKEVLIEALKVDLNPDFYFKCYETDSTWSYFIMRLAPKKYDIDVLHVDVFYVIGAPENVNELDLFRKNVREYFPMRFFKAVNIKQMYSKYSIRKICRIIINKLLFFSVTVDDITQKMKEICEMYDISKSKVCVTVTKSCRVFETEKLLETTLVKTEKGSFRITKNYDYILKTIYGNYNRIFPLENRLNEMMLHYQKISGKNIKWNCIGETGRYYDKK